MYPTDSSTHHSAYLAGGCFWGMEELLRQIPGVLSTEVGYTGGETLDANYEAVKTGHTGHAESLHIVFDSKQVSYRHLLFEFFRRHNPTTRHKQGNDIGSHYRSAIFYLNKEQHDIAQDVVKTIDTKGDWQAQLVTEVVPFKIFYRAEECHQHYLIKHPGGYHCHHLRNLDLGE
ncbi:MAG: peptide-methionine (S)-S-oxide reductase MsrA [Gallionella sp.]